jgi:hypothetical protein
VTAEQAAIELLGQRLGAQVIATAPAPLFEPPLLVELIDVPVTGSLSALCCGGWTGPDGTHITCTDCPGMAPELYAPLILGGEEAMRQTDPAFALWAPVVVEEDDRLSGPLPVAPAGGAPTDRQPENGAEPAVRPAGRSAWPGAAITAEGDLPLAGTPENRERLRAAIELRAPVVDPAAAPLVREPVTAGGVVLRAPASSPPADTDALRIELTEAVMAYCLQDPRTLQTKIGPSEIGHPCDARVTRSVLELPKYNTRADPWASFVGQATHAKLADVFEWANKQRTELGLPLYVVERKVYVVGDGSDPDGDIGGSCDLMRDGLVIDHKIVGNDSMRELKSAGWQAKGGIYTVQLDLYGLGYERAGHRVTEVALAAWPRSGFLHGLHIMRRPYDRGRAEQALARLGELSARAVELGAGENDAPWQDEIATTPSKQCGFCPWFDPDLAVPNGRGGYTPRADRRACGFGRAAEKHRGAS